MAVLKATHNEKHTIGLIYLQYCGRIAKRISRPEQKSGCSTMLPASANCQVPSNYPID